MIHLFRPAEAPENPSPPVGPPRPRRRPVNARPVLARLAALLSSQRVRWLALHTVILLGLLVQGVSLLTLAYLVDLSVSLMELWADLARKHLELTL
jgi:hypothetical protein